jgi:uroporphyrinogen decarboxylase
LEIGLPFAENRLMHDDVVPQSDHQRAWTNQHEGTITSWEDFEHYDWPSPEDVDFFPLEYVCENLPEGMGFVTCHAGGVFEHVSQIMSIEGLCIATYEQPDLVAAVFDRVGALLEAYYGRLLGLDKLVAILQGDDMGFRTGTLIAPDDMKRYALPWHRRLARKTHDAGLPYFLHSCGNLETVIDSLIDDARIDGKHSYEDAIIPVEQFQERYGDRIAVLGGVDINRLSAGTPDEVRGHTRYLIETCGPRGRYAIGSGNSIPSYVPFENYLAMTDEAHEVNEAW